jgi:succinate dehydrogenase/fumarate reductase flavoprotein subunit
MGLQYAAGEVAGGIMGARRVGGMAFTDIIVFGERAGISAGMHARQNKHLNCASIDDLYVASADSKIMDVQPRGIIGLIHSEMDANCSIVRSRQELMESRHRLNHAKNLLPRLIIPRQQRYCMALCDAIKVKVMLDCALMVVNSAILREESRGCHIRRDFPEEKPEWVKHTRIRGSKTGITELGSKPVKIRWLEPGE